MATELATTCKTTSLATPSCEPPLSDKLSGLLSGKETPIVGPKTAGELRDWLAAPRSEPALPTVERVENMISRLSLATKERSVSPAEARERLDLYWRALSDIPLVDLAKAFDQILKTCTFMPTPAEIRAMASRHTALRSFRESRARHLVWLHENKWRAPIADEDLVRPEEIAAIKEQVARQFASSQGEVGEAA